MFQITEINPTEIIVTDRARKSFNEQKLNDLKKSINKVGQLNPICITKDYQLLDGERRLRALIDLGFESVRVQIMPNLAPDEIKFIELTSNREREDFKWHEELKLKYDLHNYWKQKAEKNKSKWGYRDSAEKLECALGGLSTDLKLAEAIISYPDMKLSSYENKSQAWAAYKKICDEIMAIHSFNTMAEDEKERLEKLKNGTIEKLSINDPGSVGHSDNDVGVNKVGSPVEQTETNFETETKSKSKEPKAIYVIKRYQDFLLQIPNESVGFVELDPPYAINFNENYGNIGKRKATENDWTLDNLTEFYSEYLPVIYQKMLPNSWIFCWTGIEHWMLGNQIAEQSGFKVQARPGFWIKPGGEVNVPKTTMVSNYETFILFRKDQATFNTASFKSTIECATTPGRHKVHQWEKPFDLYEKIFQTFAKPGAIFLSPFAGSGNSMIIAEKHNMIPMGCDIRDKYFYNFYDRYNKFFLAK